MKLKSFVFASFMSISSMVSAQTCIADIARTAPEANFIVNSNGTVTDRTTGLMWSRCSLGQTWNSDMEVCTGEPVALTWQQALQTTHGYELAGNNDWRLPNIKELSTLTERACVRPSINTSVFPQTTADNYWSSTPSVRNFNMAWVVAFFNSSNSLREKEAFVFVRPVRFAE